MRPSPSLSVAGLMGLVLLLAVGFAALRDPAELWAGVFYSLMLVVLLAAALGAALRPGRARAPWLGFALFGWGYFLLTFGPGPGTSITYKDYYQPRSYVSDVEEIKAHIGVNSDLLTTKLLDASYPFVHPFPSPSYVPIEFWDWRRQQKSQIPFVVLWYLYRVNYQRIGHSVACLLFAFLGSLLGRVLTRPARPAA
jgi:hypothetical protein